MRIKFIEDDNLQSHFERTASLAEQLANHSSSSVETAGCLRRGGEAIQKRAIRIIYRCAQDMPYASAIFLADLPTMSDRRD